MHVMTFDDRPEPAIRLEQARKARGFDEAIRAAEFFGWNYDTYIQHERGVRGISRAADRYAEAFRVSAGWLLTGEGRGPDPAFGQSHVLAPSIPIISWVSAGVLANNGPMDEVLGTVFVADLPKGNWIALRVEGDSMDRISPPDSIILVNRDEKSLIPFACYVISDERGRATYKRYRPDPVRFEPVSTNPAHEPIFSPSTDNAPVVIGRVRRSIYNL